MKTVANKGALKVYIIQNIDKKIPLEAIASNKAISVAELLVAMEGIVASGTKLNLSYCLDEELDENEQEEIFDFFREASDDNLDEAYEEFKDRDVSIEQLQLMRIKFLSEYGN
jgi:ATP-dependent DNA helicase RecQ